MRQLTFVFFGTGIVIAALKYSGMNVWLREMLKINVKTAACTVPDHTPANLSDPAALHGLTLDKVLLTSAHQTD